VEVFFESNPLTERIYLNLTMKSLSLTLALPLLASSSVHAAEVDLGALKEKLAGALKLFDENLDVNKCKLALTDLDGDGDLDGVTLLTVREYSGSGGSTLLVFENVKGTFANVIGQLPTSGTPIYVRQSKTNKLCDIVVYKKGIARVHDKLTGGRLTRYQYDGKAYKNGGSEKSGTVKILKSDTLLMK